MARRRINSRVPVSSASATSHAVRLFLGGGGDDPLVSVPTRFPSGSVATTWLSRSSDRASSIIRARSSGERKSRTLNTGGLIDIVSITSSASFPTGTCVISPSSVAFQRHSARRPDAADALLPLAIASAVLNRRCASAFWPSFCRMFPTRWWLLAWPGLSSMALRPCANASSCSSKSSESSTPRFTRASAFSGSAFCASRKCSSAASDSPAW
mmetsp:Transcript_2571/g.10431  ORF Transcript_2571/g.10431 Transcript_2571/m.10431 type:complete len:212 (+) Transcript_2571:488-1123(+)